MVPPIRSGELGASRAGAPGAAPPPALRPLEKTTSQRLLVKHTWLTRLLGVCSAPETLQVSCLSWKTWPRALSAAGAVVLINSSWPSSGQPVPARVSSLGHAERAC